MKELRSFSTLPNYFGLFMKNKECIELLFELLAGLPDEAPNSLSFPPVIDPKTKLPISASGGNSVPPSGNVNTVITATTTTTTGTSGLDKIDKNAGGSKKWDEEE